VRVLVITATLIVASGCSDPTLTVQIDVPAAYRAQVATVSLADYELADVTCDAIAFGDVAPQILDGALTTQVETTPGAATALAGISRIDHKVLVARGLDAGGALIVAGCATLDVIDGDARLAIGTVPAAIVTIDPRKPDLPFTDKTPISARVIDALGNPLADRWLVTRVYGPRGAPGGSTGKAGCPRAGVDDCAPTSATGDVTMVPAPSTQPGPILVQVHVEWARAQPPPVAGFASAQAFTFPLRTLAAAPPPSCAAYRTSAGVRIGCLAALAGGNLEVQHFGWVGGAIVKLPGSPAASGAIALIATPGATTASTDTLIAITESGDWLDGVTGQAIAHVDPPAAATVAAAQVVPACGKTAFVVIGFSNGAVATYDLAGAPLATFVPPATARIFELDAAGCIGDVAAPSTLYRAVVFTETRSDQATVTFALVDGPQGLRTPTWVGFGGVGFVGGANGESRLAIGQIDLSGVIVKEWLLDPAATDVTKQLVAPITHEAVSVPAQIVGGDFDGDGAADRAWLILAASGATAPGRLQIVLAATAGDVPITGVSPDLRPRPSALVVGRFDDDGTDDFALYSAQQLTVTLTGRLAVAP
jgi:hypothetical protein